MDGCSFPNFSGFYLNISEFCLNMTGFVINIIEFVLIMNGFSLYMTAFKDDYNESNGIKWIKWPI